MKMILVTAETFEVPGRGTAHYVKMPEGAPETLLGWQEAEVWLDSVHVKVTGVEHPPVQRHDGKYIAIITSPIKPGTEYVNHKQVREAANVHYVAVDAQYTYVVAIKAESAEDAVEWAKTNVSELDLDEPIYERYHVHHPTPDELESVEEDDYKYMAVAVVPDTGVQ